LFGSFFDVFLFLVYPLIHIILYNFASEYEQKTRNYASSKR